MKEKSEPAFSGFDSPNSTYVPNQLLDELLPNISDVGELKVTLVIVRFTLGFHRARAKLSQDYLMSKTGLSRNAVRRGLRGALKRGTVRVVTKPGPHQSAEYGMRVKVADEGEQLRPPAAAKPSPEAEAPKLDTRDMVAALAQVTGMDLQLKGNGARLGKFASELLRAGYTPEQIIVAYAGPDSWWRKNWRGQKGAPPTQGGITQTIKEAVAGVVQETFAEIR